MIISVFESDFVIHVFLHFYVQNSQTMLKQILFSFNLIKVEASKRKSKQGRDNISFCESKYSLKFRRGT